VSPPSRLANSLFALAIAVTVLWPSTGALALGRGPRCIPPEDLELTEDGSPTILGPSMLSPDAVISWWHRLGRSQPERLSAPIDHVLAAYIIHGETEGVRGDWALAQAILETGWFTNADTAINNYAGIGHHDDMESGYPYPDAETGVRAHVQLLKRFSAGNKVELALPEAAPRALAQATTWAQLAGTWASGDEYWTSLDGVYERLFRGVCMS
jgi:hypothetical protein